MVTKGNPIPRASSVRSGMFIARGHTGRLAPLGAACDASASDAPAVPLLTELEHTLGGARGYRHDAPNGAMSFARAWEVCRLSYVLLLAGICALLSLQSVSAAEAWTVRVEE